MRTYLDFEKPIAELESKVAELRDMSRGEGSLSILDEITTLEAKTQEATYLVRTCIIDANGENFPDVSSWFWAASRDKSTGPWWAITIAQLSQD